jgi:hypothetical protein
MSSESHASICADSERLRSSRRRPRVDAQRLKFVLDGDSLLSSLPLALTEARLQHLMVLAFNTDPVVTLEAPEQPQRRIVEISYGHFASRHDGLNGHVLRGGSDWRVRLNDGRMMLDGRLALSTDGGDTIAIRFVGRRSGEADLLTALDRGDDVRPDAYYLRLTMTFETDSARFSWLNHTIAVAKGEYRPRRQVYNVLQLL